MAAGLPVRACLLVVLLVATTAAANRHARLPTAQNPRATGDEDAPPTTPARGRYHSEPEQQQQQQQLPELPQEIAQLDPAATATAARLVSALLRALAAPPPTESPKFGPNVDSGDLENPWRGAARELAGDLLADGRLSVLVQEPPVAAAMARELRGLRCEVAAVDDEQQQPHPPQRPDSGGAAGGAPLLRLPPLSGEAASDSLRVHVGAHVDEGDAAAGSLRPRPPLPHHKKRDESGGGPLLRAPRSGASCATDGDCPLGQYCDSIGSCYECSYVNPSKCDDASGDCCSAAFRTQCPANPARCPDPCERDGDCSGGEVCSLGVCARPSPDKAALLAAFVRDPRTAATWGALRGWSNASEPCAWPRWEGVTCSGQASGRVTRVDLHGRLELRFELGPAVGSLRYLDYLRLYGSGMFGTIPRELGNLTALQNLNLHSNPSLSGTIPRELGSLTALQNL
eukprot:COSAG06_NODE_7506_length_2480_cov_5.763965_1_plen_455_part_10